MNGKPITKSAISKKTVKSERKNTVWMVYDISYEYGLFKEDIGCQYPLGFFDSLEKAVEFRQATIERREGKILSQNETWMIANTDIPRNIKVQWQFGRPGLICIQEYAVQ